MHTTKPYLQVDGKNGPSRWCASCAKPKGGVALGKPRMCEDCQQFAPCYGLPSPGR